MVSVFHFLSYFHFLGRMNAKDISYGATSNQTTKALIFLSYCAICAIFNNFYNQ